MACELYKLLLFEITYNGIFRGWEITHSVKQFHNLHKDISWFPDTHIESRMATCTWQQILRRQTLLLPHII